MTDSVRSDGDFFRRILLPGLAFKGVVIGGGYATGRELVEFFLLNGPRSGIAGLLLVMLLWSAICALTFLFAYKVRATDYRAFFRALLGRFWLIFEIAYLLLMILVLSVMCAAAGEIAGALAGLPLWIGTTGMIVAIVAVAATGTEGAERLFRYASLLIYGAYILFAILCIASFGDRIPAAFAAPAEGTGWIGDSLTYASYNVVGAVVILPFLRHQRSGRDAVAAGLLSGPLAILPALLFFVCMAAWYPAIAGEALPSDFLLQLLGSPWFRIVFQAMILAALLETGVGLVNALNERASAVAPAQWRPLGWKPRLAISAAIVVGAGLIATRFGLVELIASGYSVLGCVILAVFLVPLATVGIARILRERETA